MENTQNILTEEKPNRCVMVMNDGIDGGYLANAIAVIALTVGQRHPHFVAEPLVDASGVSHPGLIAAGIPMLKCNNESLHELRKIALEKGCDVVDFPFEGQQTKDYDEFLQTMTTVKEEDINYLGIAIIGKKNAVNRITKHCEMIR